MKNSLVSVIITTKNEGKYLEKTLRAVKDQTYRPLEIIVSDAESTDDTVKIARKYRAGIVVKETNIPEGKNLGARNSRGYVLVFLDADTILAKNWIEKAVKKLMSDRVDLVVGIFRPVERLLMARVVCYLWSDLLPSILRLFGVEMHAGSSTFAVRRDFFFRMHGFKEKLVAMEDAEFINRISQKGKVLWDRSLVGRTSMRRFEKGGYVTWLTIWLVTGLEFLLRGKISLKNYKVIR